MISKEIAKFLDEPLMTTFTSLRSDGSPHVSPMWYQYEGGKFFCQVSNRAVKTQNVRNDPRVALCIATQHPTSKCVMVYGTCEVSRHDVSERVYSISRRYHGMQKGSSFAKEILGSEDMVILVVTPSRVVTEQWD